MNKFTSLKDVDKMIEEKLSQKNQPPPVIEKLRQIAMRNRPNGNAR